MDCKMWLSPNPRLLPGLLVCLSACRLCLAVVFTNSDFSIQPNKAFNLKWDQNEGPVTLSVVTGTSDSAQQVVTIAELALGSSRYWTPSSSLQLGTYYFRVKDEVTGEVNYSPEWKYSTTSSSSDSPTQGSSRTTSAASGSSSGTSQHSQQTSTARSTGTFSTSTRSSFSTTLVVPAGTGADDDQASSTSNPTSETPSSGLSSGAKAGIGVGAGLGGILLLAAVAFLFYRKGKSRAERENASVTQGQEAPASQEPKSPATHRSYPELGVVDEKPIPEIAGMPIAEVPGANVHVNPNTRSKFVELP
uniref:Yeast cell wall synthesis Kre9/Knh1-like N-terminal domain-containing protein n=1 Tax=Bionectria ochroleuca TaxID=29856 RepID=A0A8H7NBQ7_BIOOC